MINADLRERIDRLKAEWPDRENRFAPPDITVCRRIASTPLAPPPVEQLTHINSTGHRASNIAMLPQVAANSVRRARVQSPKPAAGRPSAISIDTCPDGRPHRFDLSKGNGRRICSQCGRTAYVAGPQPKRRVAVRPTPLSPDSLAPCVLPAHPWQRNGYRDGKRRLFCPACRLNTLEAAA